LSGGLPCAGQDGRERKITREVVETGPASARRCSTTKTVRSTTTSYRLSIKLRGSDPDAALTGSRGSGTGGGSALHREENGPVASEDVGNADPQALSLAMAAMQAFDFIGLPKGAGPSHRP